MPNEVGLGRGQGFSFRDLSLCSSRPIVEGWDATAEAGRTPVQSHTVISQDVRTLSSEARADKDSR